MSVRDALLAILTLGPAYGHQLHAELAIRTPHRGAVNVGQIYGTLDRLTARKLIEPAGTTDDSLPLHRLTRAGHAAADRWMSTVELAALPEWTEMLDQVVVVTSIAPNRAKSLAEDFRRWWEADLAAARDAAKPDSMDARLAAIARETQGVAAIAWLGSAIAALSDYEGFRPLNEARPRRGRRPAPAPPVE
ncbi:PadR family transcriptional regulator [Lacisediminihabitans changchengi]|uniref:PadR family transcriptional regulator n=1 Tax=Lacisediminihabitans changchengi TaxID=2787634 RepID=A0A934W199_9MICO|nr:PadR family transcriptional regulator [Lacisediminihabitans changchengi]MBK4346653.1 PadR family transcriptional regulator [Lacisediminihabitans changchengi]